MDLFHDLGVGDARLAMTTFVASEHPAESCGHNGLPLTPNSINILGHAERLKCLKHHRLCEYLDFQRGKNERIVCVSEYHERSLRGEPFDKTNFSALTRIAIQLLEGLSFLESKDIVHLNLSCSNTLLTKSGDKEQVKLFDYGLGHLSNYGALVGFPLSNPKTCAPEVLAEGPINSPSSYGSVRGDDDSQPDSPANADSIAHILPAPTVPYKANVSVWTMGLIILSKSLGMQDECELWPSLNISQVLRKVLSLQNCDDILKRIAREHNCLERLEELPVDLKALLTQALEPNPSERPGPTTILNKIRAFERTDISAEVNTKYDQAAFPTINLRCKDLALEDLVLNGGDDNVDDEDDETALDVLTLQEIYYLFQLAGGDLVGELRKNGLLTGLPPVLTIPKVVMNEGHSLGQTKERCTLFEPKVMSLSLNQLRSCLEDLNTLDFYPLCFDANDDLPKNAATLGSTDSGDSSGKVDYDEDTSSLPLIIKEKDVRYQFKRIILYRRLLCGYPYMRPAIWKEAKVDVLPLYRAYIWASLLGIEHDVRAAYEAIDKESWTPTDRQIEVDIPRCHQYNHLLASAEGHRKFKRVLKAWVQTNLDQYVYWQGLDSLCAPFLYLNFNDEALAFACLSAFIPKYLYGMFRRDNAAVIQEYLAKFSHIQAFHDPILFNHLDGIGFIPELYAIPWVLTMFAHVFPLQNIFHLWDKLLLGSSAFPLCVALSILYQLRERLLAAEFNDCILLFSDLPAIDIEKCVSDSVQIFCSTPKSLTYRKYGSARTVSRPSDLYSQLTLESVTLEMQRSDKVPRISGEELLNLLGLRPSLDPSKRLSHHHHQSPQQQRSRVIVLDVRSKADYKLGSLPGSINIPFAGAFGDEGHLQAPSEVIQTLNQRRSKVLCVVGSNSNSTNDDANAFALALLRLNYNRLCMLHGGIEIFRAVDVLCVPNA